MAGLQIENETVYVIYHNGKPYQSSGRKIVYTKRGAANGVVTKDAGSMAEWLHDRKRERHGYTIPSWWDLGQLAREHLIDEVRQEFQVIEYGPKQP